MESIENIYFTVNTFKSPYYSLIINLHIYYLGNIFKFP